MDLRVKGPYYPISPKIFFGQYYPEKIWNWGLSTFCLNAQNPCENNKIMMGTRLYVLFIYSASSDVTFIVRKFVWLILIIDDLIVLIFHPILLLLPIQFLFQKVDKFSHMAIQYI